MVASPGPNQRPIRSRTGTPNPHPPAAASSSQRSYPTRGASKQPSHPLTPIQTSNLDGAASEDDDRGSTHTQQMGSSKGDADAGSDDDDDRLGSRRASTRLAAKAAAREIAAQTAPSPPQAPKKLPKATTPAATTAPNAAAGSSGAGRGGAATPGADTTSSPGGTPAPLADPTSLNKLADVASKVSKARKGPYIRSAPSVPSTRELLTTIEATGSADVVEVLVTDPNDMLAGYKQLEDWIYGGLDMYRAEFYPLLFPIFCHFYIELISQGFKDSALQFYKQHAEPLREHHAADIHHLSSLLLPSHVPMSSFAQRLRSEKYILRMSRAGFALFVGWLTEGTGGEGMGAGDGIMSGREGAGRRARFTVLKVVHGSLKFNVTSANTSSLPASSYSTETGLVSSLLPTPANGFRIVNGKQVTGSFPTPDAASFNTYQGDLKLGPAPLGDALRDEVERVIKEEDGTGAGGDGMALDQDGGQPNGDVKMEEDNKGPSVLDLSAINGTTGLAPPLMSDLLPQSSIFRSVDVRREVERVRDARKRIRLDPSVLYAQGNGEVNGFSTGGANGNVLQSGGNGLQSSALPSICAYTFHDAQDGINCSSFSEDSTLMAAGFGENYIRIWNLKKEKFKALRSDFSLNNITDAYALRKLREKSGSSTRRLIGHSGPVFATSFSTHASTSSAPRYLLSASADTTVRLWSIETLTNVVAYRGHRNPVWDVQWASSGGGGGGSWFATGSRDRTARLWCTERVNALRVFAGHLGDVDVVRWHPNSLYLATGSSDMTCRLWDVQRGTCMRVFLGHSGPITSMAVSPDGRYLASASTDLSINLWDLGSGRKIKSMMGHTAPINTLSFSACTTMLISGGSDWTVRAWDVKAQGGMPMQSMRLNGALPDGAIDEREGRIESTDLLQTFHTKRTSVLNVQVTPRNLVLMSGVYMPKEGAA